MEENFWFNKTNNNQAVSQIVNNIKPNELSTILEKYITSYLIKRIPIEITYLPQKDEEYKIRNKEFVDSFCRKWIPRLYGVNNLYPQYRNACLCEFIRWHIVFGIAINYNTAKAHWYWEPETRGDVPDKLKMIAGIADIIYSILWRLGIRIRYRIQTF